MARKQDGARDQTRERARQLREQQQRADRRTRNTIIAVVGVLLVAIVVAIAVIVRSESSKSGGSGSGVLGPYADGAPVVVSHKGVGKADSSLPTLTEYLDYSCEVCAHVESVAGSAIDEDVKAGRYNLEVQPVTTVGMAYQKPATTASLIVAQKDPDHWLAFHTHLLQYFWQQYSAGDSSVIQSDSASFGQVKAIAKQAGVPQDVIDTFQQNAVEDYLKTTTAAWGKKTFEGRDPNNYGTPEFVAGHKKVVPVTNFDANTIRDDLRKAASAAGTSDK